MFKFDFINRNTDEVENTDEVCKKEDQLNWFPARKIDIPFLKKNCDNLAYITVTKFPNISLKLINSEKVVIKLEEENCENIIEAESEHSDLLPAKYEGGFKVWECTYDLGQYILTEDIAFKNKTVLDLGCGAGIVGLLAFIRGSSVHFQDYNAEVIESFTIPNVLLNCDDHNIVKDKCEFYCGDWESFSNLLSDDENKKYDFIFTSETIYNSDNHKKLYQVFKKNLKKNGIGFIAGKTYYFGVGGGMRQFEELILRDGEFKVSVIWMSIDGLQREILKLERKTQ